MATSLLVLASLCAVGGLLGRAVKNQWRHPTNDAWTSVTDRTWRDRLIAATICCAPLLMPFYFDYDLLLLAVPAVLFAAEELARPAGEKRDRPTIWLARAWLVLYLWTMINPGLANQTHVNGSVLLLSAIAVLMTLRATPRKQPPVEVSDSKPAAVTMTRRAA